MKRLAMAAGLLALAVLVGFCAGWSVLYLSIAILPPFRPEDDDTLREFIPVALTYLTWGLTTLLAFRFGWRRLRQTGRGRSPST